MQKMKKELTPVVYNAAALKVLHFRVPPNRGCFRTHWHDRVELLRIKRGTILVGHGSSKTPAGADTLVLFPPHMPHGGYTGDEAVEYDTLMFDVRSFYNDTEICRKYLTALYENGLAARQIRDCPELLACVDNLCSETLSPMAAVAETYRLLALLIDRVMEDLPLDGQRDSVAKEFVTYLEEHYAQELSLEEISRRFGYSKAHFCRKFREFTGLGPMQYLKIVRVEKGYEAIWEGERNMGKVAAMCGFSDANYFTRCFKERYGFPPTQMRKER